MFHHVLESTISFNLSVRKYGKGGGMKEEDIVVNWENPFGNKAEL